MWPMFLSRRRVAPVRAFRRACFVVALEFYALRVTNALIPIASRISCSRDIATVWYSVSSYRLTTCLLYTQPASQLSLRDSFAMRIFATNRQSHGAQLDPTHRFLALTNTSIPAASRIGTAVSVTNMINDKLLG